MSIMDETELTATVVANQRSYTVPRDVAAELSRMRTALEPAMRALAHIAIESDQDCTHANDPRAMTVIARLALAQARAAIAERALVAQERALTTGEMAEQMPGRWNTRAEPIDRQLTKGVKHG